MWEPEDAGCLAWSSHKGTSFLNTAVPLICFLQINQAEAYKPLLRGDTKVRQLQVILHLNTVC